MTPTNQLIINFSQIYGLDESLIGKKAHELGILHKLGIPLPRGFLITNEFYEKYLRLTGIDPHDASFPNQLMKTHIPQDLAYLLHKFYRDLSGIFKEKPLNIFSSQKNKSPTFSNVHGDANLVMKIKKIWIQHLKGPIAIIVQETIDSKIKGNTSTENPIADKKLNKDQTQQLVKYCALIKKYFYFPKEIEYSIYKNKLIIVRISPFTGTVNESFRKPSAPTAKVDEKRPLIKGIPLNQGIASGPVKVLHKLSDHSKVKKGDIIVIPILKQSSFHRLKGAKAIIIDSALSHSLDKAIYRRSFRIPTIEGTKNAIQILKNGNVITVNGMNGEIYSGGLI